MVTDVSKYSASTSSVWNEIKYVGGQIANLPNEAVDFEADIADKIKFDPFRFAGGYSLLTGKYTPVNREAEKILLNIGLIWAMPELTPMVGEFLIASGVPAELVVGAGVMTKLKNVVGRVELLGMIAKNLGYSGIEAKNVINLFRTGQLLVHTIQKDESISRVVKQRVQQIVDYDKTGIVDKWFGVSDWSSNGPGAIRYTGPTVHETEIPDSVLFSDSPDLSAVKDVLDGFYTLASYKGGIDYTGTRDILKTDIGFLRNVVNLK